MTSARSNQLTANINRSKDVKPYKDIAAFLPHPAQWQKQTNECRTDISKATAIEFLRSLSSLPGDVAVVFDDWLSDIQSIALD